MCVNINPLSPEDSRYNCFAWAVNYKDRWWGTDENEDFWPDGIPREETLEAYIESYRQIGYEVCEEELPEKGYLLIAIYVDHDGEPSHAAKYNPETGLWESKLGVRQDVEHDFADEFILNEGVDYGTLAIFMKKQISLNHFT